MSSAVTVVSPAALPPDEWYWEQDAQLRFTRLDRGRFEHPAVPAGFGGRRWEIPGAVALSSSWEEHRRVLEARQPFRDFKYAIFRPDGPTCYVAATGEPLFDASGAFRGYRGVARDITQEHTTLHRLHEAQARLQLAAALGRLGWWTCDVATGLVHWSDQVRAIHEIPQAHTGNIEQALTLYVPECREMLRAAYERCAREGVPYDLQLKALTQDGRPVWVRVMGVPERGPNGEIVRVHGAFQDIHSIKTASERHRLIAEELGATLDSLTDGFVRVDPDWRITYVNAVAGELLGREPAALVGALLHDEFASLRGSVFQSQLQRAASSGTPADFEAFYEPQGLWLRMRAVPSSRGLAISFTDVTAQHETRLQLEERVAQRTEELRLANRELESFAYSVSHDLRAPLAALAGFSQVLLEREGERLSEKGRDYLQRMRRAAVQMDEMTTAMLEFARLSRADVDRRACDLSAMARDIVAELREREPARSVHVEIEPGIVAAVDPRLFVQALRNLLDNAWKYTRHQPRAEISFGRARRDGTECLFVRDNGVGFDMAHAGKLFEAFNRLHSASEFEGSGVGLATVHKIISRHGGRVWAQSAPGAGTSVFFAV